MNKFSKQTGKYGKIFKSIKKIGIVFLLLFFVFSIARIQGTSSFFTDEATISGSTFSAGYWIPDLTMTVSPASPDGENGFYKTTPCVTLSADIDGKTEGIKIYYEFSNDGDPISGGTAYAGICVPIPDGDPTHFQAQAVNDENPDWKSNIVSQDFKVDTICPFVNLTNPDEGNTLNGSVEIRGTVTDANPHHYWLVIENSSGSQVAGPGTVNDTNSFTDKKFFDWDMTAFPDGDYRIKLEARDAAGNKCPNQAPVLTDPNNPNDSVDWIDVKVGKSTVKTHIYKFLDGQQATPATADRVSFPMKTTYSAANIGSGNNIPFTLKPGGWSAGDIDYEASTSDMTSGADYSAWEVTVDDLVGATCDGGQPYELKGYTTGETLAAAKDGTPSAIVPDFQNMQSDKYVIVWNETCEVAPAPTLKVHILKYLDGEKADTTFASGYQFPMTATWKTANLNGGAETSENYVLGSNHGGATDQYGADTAPMEAPADYTTSEITDGASQVLPIGADCAEGKYRLKGYTKSDESFADADDPAKISHTAPEFNSLEKDQYVIVWNEICSAEQPGTGEIRGTKYEDKDGDGNLEHDEHRKLSGVTIYLDANDNETLDPGEILTVTKKSGKYRFQNLPAGTYHVREVPKAGWVQTFPVSGKYDAIVVAGKIAKKKDFGNFKLGSISGMKFEDKNGNGRKDRNEFGLKDWTIKLTKPGQSDITARTDANGNFSFDNLPAGNYLVREVQQDGWKQMTRNPHPIFIHSGDSVNDVNFGNQQK